MRRDAHELRIGSRSRPERILRMTEARALEIQGVGAPLEGRTFAVLRGGLLTACATRLRHVKALSIGCSVYDPFDLERALEVGLAELEHIHTAAIPITGAALVAVLSRDRVQSVIASMEAVRGPSMLAAVRAVESRSLTFLDLWRLVAATSKELDVLADSLTVTSLALHHAIALRREHVERLLTRCGRVRCYGASRIGAKDRAALVARHGSERIRFAND